MTSDQGLKLGANFRPTVGCDFLVWAPRAERVDVHFLSPGERRVAMHRGEHGYFRAQLGDVRPGALYFYRLNDAEERPDPASRFQPQGVHGPSQVIDPSFDWSDSPWRGLELADFVFYELHVGAFTREGTFDAVLPRLAELKDLGITAIELMPVAQFPGARNWGYDGVFPFAVQSSYGGPAGLKRLVDRCHRTGLAVVLDVVYNHLGPEGNYLSRFGPYFTDWYRTPWGQAVNFDQPQSDEVRRFFIENALYWVSEFHVDALRLDAVHAITDTSAGPFLAELARRVHGEGERIGRKVFLIPESNQNDARLVTPPDRGGYGLDALWNDDFHHALHVLLTGETGGYYRDFGTTAGLARAFSDGFVYAGQYSKFRERRHGTCSRALPAERFVVFAQNHDQVGNRRLGERLSALVSFEALKLAAGVVALSPYLPLFFMGEEYGEPAPFAYFVSHEDAGLIEAVRRGRQAEFSGFGWQGEIPDPQGEATFERSCVRWGLRHEAPHKFLLAFYRELLRLRRENPVLGRRDKKHLEAVAFDRPKALLVRRWHGEQEMAAVFHFEKDGATITAQLPAGRWEKILDSSDAPWGGPGSSLPRVIDAAGEVEIALLPSSFVVFAKVRKERR